MEEVPYILLIGVLAVFLLFCVGCLWVAILEEIAAFCERKFK